MSWHGAGCNVIFLLGFVRAAEDSHAFDAPTDSDLHPACLGTCHSCRHWHPTARSSSMAGNHEAEQAEQRSCIPLDRWAALLSCAEMNGMVHSLLHFGPGRARPTILSG